MNFGVECLDHTVRRDDQRVDLAEHRVRLDKAPVELLDDRRDLLLLARILDPAGIDEVARDPRLPALQRVDVQAHERVRVVRGDLLDLHPTLRREHQERLLGATVERDREVVLLRDVGCLLDPDLPDDVAANVEAQDLARLLLGVGRIDGELHAACLAAAARQHLSLHDHRPAELLGRLPRLLGRRREASFRNRDAETPEHLLALVLVQIHAATLAMHGRTTGRLL